MLMLPLSHPHTPLLPPAEFAAAGSLASYLRSGVGFIPLRQRAQLALHAANGMAYLHSLKVRCCFWWGRCGCAGWGGVVGVGGWAGGGHRCPALPCTAVGGTGRGRDPSVASSSGASCGLAAARSPCCSPRARSGYRACACRPACPCIHPCVCCHWFGGRRRFISVFSQTPIHTFAYLPAGMPTPLTPSAVVPQVVHFDVKPDNLLVDGDWSSEQGPSVKVVSLCGHQVAHAHG